MKAFTLIELLVTLLLATLLSLAVGLSLIGRKNMVDQRELVERVIAFDAGLRMQSEQSGKNNSLLVDLSAGRLSVISSQTQQRISTSFELPEGFRFQEVRFRNHSVGSGSVGIPFWPRGASPAYAMCIVGPKGWRRWIFFVGMTGQAIIKNDQKQIHSIFTLAVPAGNDAH